nr:gag [Homo sapiens]
MGNIPPKAKTPLRCILENWDQCDTQTLRKKRFIFFCSTAWPQYPLQGRETWLPEGSINYNIILQLDLFCRKEGKWSEVPYVQTFFSLRDNSQLCKKCGLCPTGSPQSPPPYPSVPPPTPSSTNKDPPLTQTVQKEIDKGVNNEPKSANIPRLCPLQAVRGGEFGPARVPVPFSLSDLKQIKIDLGKFSDNPDGYIDVLQGLGQSFDLTWRDIMLLLNQTLTPNERSAAVTAAREFGDLWYLSQVNNRMTTEERTTPTGQQAVPSVDPHWDTESEHGDWCHKHLLTCVLEGLRKTRKKPMNYSMMSTITQGKEENPTAFLDRLREALRKHTSLSPDSIEGQLILKDKFITQSAADIRKNFKSLP